MRASIFRVLLLALVAAPATAQIVAVSSGQVVGGATAVPQNGAPPRDTGPATGTARIRGRITDAATGAGLRRANVRASAPELRGIRTTTTDNNGRFEFPDLPAGRYQISANKSGYVDITYGALGPLEQGKTLRLGDKQSLDNINFAVPRGSVITGRVVDEFGEPVADAMVVPMRWQSTPGGRRPMPAGRSAQTNDIGEFRLYGLPPGQYLVSANYRQMNMVSVNGQLASDNDHSGYAPTYYPAAANVAEAQTITVGVAEVMPEIGIMLVPTRTSTVSGMVLDGQGAPVKGGMVLAMLSDAAGMGTPFGGANGQIRPDGSFTLSGLTAGNYTLRSTGNMGPAGPPQSVSIAKITVSGNDLQGVVLAPLTPVVLHGRVILDSAAASAFRPQTVRFIAQPTEINFMGPLGPAAAPQPVAEDFTFTVQAAPGELIIRPTLPAGWMVRRIRLGSEDITDGFTLRADERGTIEAELSNQAPQISGAMVNRNGEAVAEGYAVWFPEDYERERKSPIGHYAMARGDQNGRYTVRTLLPGTYYVVAVPRIQMGQQNDPEYLARLRPSAVRVTIQEGDNRSLDLRLIEN